MGTFITKTSHRLLLLAILVSSMGEAKRATTRSQRQHDRRCAEALAKTLPKPNLKYWLRHLPPRGWSNRPWGDRSEIKAMTFNIYNVLTHAGRPEYVWDGQKRKALPPRAIDPAKVRAKAGAILDVMPEVVMLQEIEGGAKAEEVLNQFAREHLGGLYVAFVPRETNDPLGIKQGFLVRKDLMADYQFRIVSHVDRRYNAIDRFSAGSRHNIFTRDLPILLMTKKGDAEPFVAFANAHVKSRRPKLTESERKSQKPRAVVEAMARKRAERIAGYEVREMIKILNKFYRDFPQTPYVLSGDFNRDIGSSEMLRSLVTKANLREGLAVNGRRLREQDKATAMYFRPGVGLEADQSDGNFLSRHFSGHVIDSWVYRFRDPNHGSELTIPESYAERESEYPSDHFPVVVVLSTEAWPSVPTRQRRQSY
ncbi:MAG TPA: hypothetical protein VM901_07815 [Bdellovibrionota bacterium]|jgi:hypothetical protein|nr:hypothetical protein [Bdellovibrionota bacterium]